MKPFLSKVNVFEARTEGYYNFRIPALLMTRQQVLVAFAEGRRGSGSDWDMNDVVMRRSFDGGETWEDTKVLYSDSTCSNIVPIVDRDGKTIHLLFCVDYKRCYYMKSVDGCETFSKPVEITPAFEAFRSEYDWKVLATGPCHGIHLRSGRLLVPVWLSLSLDKHGHHPSVASVIYSDDGGETWNTGEIVKDIGTDMSETVAVELQDGAVYLNIRNESDKLRRCYVTSKDGSGPWSEPAYAEELLEPICCASLIRLSGENEGEDSKILFCNPANPEPNPNKKRKKRERKRLTVRMSCDETRSWPYSRVIEEGDAEYSDMAVGADKTIYCFYGRDFISGQNDCRYMTVAKFNEAWIREGCN